MKFVDEGLRGRVFQVKDRSTGKIFALKVAIDSQRETLRSIAEETEKEALYARYGVPHAEIVESSTRYVVKEWIEGERADVWVARWLREGADLEDPALKALAGLLEDMATQRVYIGDMNRKNLIWDAASGGWFVIDSGSVIQKDSAAESLHRLIEKISDRWGKEGERHLRRGLCRSLTNFAPPPGLWP